MVVYFDHKINVGQPGTFHLMAWHGTEPVLAVTARIESENEGAVFLFTEDGERIETSPLQKKCLPSAINWHPSKLVLCMGWEDGIVYLYNLQTRELCRAQHIHNSAITGIQCSTNGTKIVTGDESGLLLIWKIDSRGRVQTKPLFQQHLREPLREIISQPRRNSNHDNYMEVRNLVRAAVSGDQKALDMFDWKKAGSDLQFPAFFASMESPAFYVGGASGGVYYLQESGSCNHLFSADGPILKLLFHKEKNILVTLTTNLILSQHSITNAGQVSEIAKVKLSGKTDNPSVTWAGKGILAMATGESVLRIYDMDREENYLLSLDGHQSYDSNEQILCVGFCDRKAVLAAGTQMGNIAMWQYSLVNNSVLKKVDGEENWKLQDPATVEGPVRELMWNPSTNLLAVNTSSMAYVLNEHTMSCSLNDQTAVVQIGPSSLAIDMFSSGTHHDIKTDIQVKGIYTTKGTLAVWNGKKVFIYDFSPDQSIIQVTGAFETESQCICLYQQNVYVLEQDKVQVRTLKGTEKQLLNFSETEGHPVCMDVCGNFLVVGTSNGMVRVYDLSRREAKPHSILKILHEVIPGFGKIVSVKCNCSGSRVSILSEKPNGEPCPKLYFWDLELDAVQFFNFETGHGEQDDYLSSQLSENITADMNDTERGKDQAAKDIAGRYPTSHFWDFREPRLICCEAKLLLAETKPKISVKKSGSLIGKEMVNVLPDTMVVSLFSTAENGVLVQESYGLDDRYSCLMGIDVPFHYLLKKSQNKENSEEENDANNSGSLLYPRMVVRKTMRDFVGLENSDTGTQEAMMNFSFYLAIGNMDEAFKAIKLIKSESVWENMAKMCVKSRRLDVASVCLGNMGHGRGAKALREAAKEPELDARVAVLAIHLNMLEDAERLIKSSKRYDLLNQFYQNSGQWSKAKETAEMYDRIHLRTTYYNYAKDLEARGEIQASIPNYEKSDTHRYEVPRMLYEDSAHLMEYIMRSKDKILHKWYAQYLESVGDLNSATQQYEIAQDFLSLVRIACYCNEMNKAADICNQTGDRAACYHLARQYEIKGHIRESIHFFTRAEGFGNAIRLCMEHGFVDQILNLALLGRPEDMMMAARFFEEQQEMEDKAVMLYHKAGNFSKAMELSFQSKQFGALQLISSDLDERADPELVQRCANFFLENKQYDKAVDLLALGKKYWDAVNLCMEQHVLLTEELVEKLTPVKEDTMDQLKILEAIAEVCMHQGQYHLATKKFTQAGNKIKAMKSLLKSGDTEKIVFFAGVSRQKEIYVMAANYLQSLDWRRDTEIMKNIIMFYTKGRALDLLAGFYDACAQVEIDEYQNYEKAMGALNEGYRCLKKASMKNQNVQEQRLEELTNKMTLIKKFISCRSYSDSPDEAIKQCQMLLEEPDLESSVRIGDVYSFIVEHHVAREKWKAAFSSLEELKNKVSKTSITLYISPKTVEKIYRSLGMPVPKPLHTDRINGLRNSPEDNGEFVEEEVAED